MLGVGLFIRAASCRDYRTSLQSMVGIFRVVLAAETTATPPHSLTTVVRDDLRVSSSGGIVGLVLIDRRDVLTPPSLVLYPSLPRCAFDQWAWLLVVAPVSRRQSCLFGLLNRSLLCVRCRKLFCLSPLVCFEFRQSLVACMLCEPVLFRRVDADSS